MNDFLKKYRIRLKTIGPVFIGSGHNLRKREWLLNHRKTEALVLDYPKLFDYLSKRNLIESFEYFLLAEHYPMYKWMSDNGITEKEYAIFENYRLNTENVEFSRDARDMLTFIKDAYGKPYVPGSSLKGAIRNTILAKNISDDNLDASRVKSGIETFKGNKRNFLRTEKDEIERKYFYTNLRNKEKPRDIVNDCMSGIRISDSKPLSLDTLTLCQKIDINSRDYENDLPILRECIRPNTEIQFDMTVDETEVSLSIDYIKEAISDYLAIYNMLFLDNFTKEEQYNDNVIYLGGGTGFASKTVLNQILGRTNDSERVKLIGMVLDKTIGKTTHCKDYINGVSPRVVKLTEYDHELIQMGPCEIEIVSV